jgi:hypothetical protein
MSANKILMIFFLQIAPIPASVQTILGTICKDVPGSYNDTSIWVYSRGEGACSRLEYEDINNDHLKMANKIVFVFQMPLPRDGKILDYSRWQQNLIGILQTVVFTILLIFNCLLFLLIS